MNPLFQFSEIDQKKKKIVGRTGTCMEFNSLFCNFMFWATVWLHRKSENVTLSWGHGQLFCIKWMIISISSFPSGSFEPSLIKQVWNKQVDKYTDDIIYKIITFWRICEGRVPTSKCIEYVCRLVSPGLIFGLRLSLGQQALNWAH